MPQRGAYELLPLNDSTSIPSSRKTRFAYTCSLHRRVTALHALVLTCLLLIIAYGVFLSGFHEYTRTDEIPPPVAKRIPSSKIYHGVEIKDDFEWLQNIHTDPDVLDYVNQESAYSDAQLRKLRPLRQKIAGELQTWKQSTKLAHDECQLPKNLGNQYWLYGSFIYWINYAERFPIYMRRPIMNSSLCDCDNPNPNPGREEVVLDYNELLPSDTSYFLEGIFEINTRNEDLLAFSYDMTGSEEFTIFFRNLTEGKLFGSKKGIPRTSYSARWGVGRNGEDFLYYNVIDPIYGIPRMISRYCVTGCLRQANDRSSWEELVYIEPDISLTTEVGNSNDANFTYIKVVGQVTSETVLLSNGGRSLSPLFYRVTNTHYTMEHRNGYFYVLTNAGGAFNYQILRVDAQEAIAANVTIEQLVSTMPSVKVLLPHAKDTFIERMEVFTSHLLAWVRVDGLREFLTINLEEKNGPVKRIGFQDPNNATTQVYSVFPGTISSIEARLFRRFHTTCILYANSSFTQPTTVWSYDMRTERHQLLSQDIVKSFDASLYTERRVWVNSTSEHAVRIPISIVHPRNRSRGPIVIAAYGAYGSYYDPQFSIPLLPFLERGISYARCHPQGDGDMGSQWYTNGKYERKPQTFRDVADCLKGLIDDGIAEEGKIAVYCRSAGGLIGGSVINDFEDRFSNEGNAIVKVVVAQVPFVDPIGDMSDITVPWTAFEYFEWGDPVRNSAIFNAMLHYSPYHNVRNKGEMPSVFISGGLKDSRVPFYEPVKWVAKLRQVYAKQQEKLLLRLHDTGHLEGGMQEVSEWMSFIVYGLVSDISVSIQ